MSKNLTRFNPFGELSLSDQMKGMENMLKDFRLMPSWGALSAEPRIKMDVTETDKTYEIKADIPGVNKEDIKVMIDGNQLSISAEIKKETEEKSEGNLLSSERYYGQQYRSLSLGHDIDDKKAKAKYNNGVLELTLPKKAGSTSKQLTIN